MLRTALLKSGHVSEKAIHKAVIEWATAHPKLRGLVLHVPNEGKRTRSYGKLLKDMGMIAGISDLFIAMGRRGFYGAWIELKSCGGKLSISQKEFLFKMNQQNYYTAVCWSLEEAINIISWYCDI